MGHFLALALAFPTVVYTVLLGVALVYWVFVMVGAAHVNLLGGGDGAADAVADAAASAAVEGVAKGALEGATKGLLEGAAEHLDGGVHGGDVGDIHGASHGLMASLKLRSAPATVVMSAVLLFSWIFTMLAMEAVEGWLPANGVFAALARVGVLVLAPLLALFPSSLAIRPLAGFFTPLSATKREELVV